MTKTTQNLAEAVLRRLRVIDATETPANEDAAAVKALYLDLHDELITEDIAYWPDTQIPAEVFRALVDYVAGHAAVDFGKNDMIALATDGETRLRRIVQFGHTKRPTRAEYF